MIPVSDKVLEEAVEWMSSVQDNPDLEAKQNAKGVVSIFDKKTGVCRYQMTPAIWDAIKTKTSLKLPNLKSND